MLLKAATHVVDEADNVKVTVACYNQKQFDRAQQMLQEHAVNSPIELHLERTPELMKAADACMACSGSVSLELMFHKKPTVIVYKPSRLFMFLQNWMLNIKYITLVNLIGSDDIQRTSRTVYDPDAADSDAVMPEYLTCVDRSKEMSRHVIGWFQNPETAAAKVVQLGTLAEKYSQAGATERAANYILNSLAPLSYRRISESEVLPYEAGLLDSAAESGFGESISEEKAA